MGKILLTNNGTWNEKLRKNFSHQGFRENGKIDNGGGILSDDIFKIKY